AQWAEIATDKAFQDKIDLLRKARQEYEELSNKFAADKVQLQKNARELQLRRFLEQFFISDYDIPGVGPTRKSTLASFGIETAADVSYNQVRTIKGFGERLTGELMNWRKR
ncbi:helix-hairpin-helix domain-containing protein, partial [Salmonella enterica]